MKFWRKDAGVFDAIICYHKLLCIAQHFRHEKRFLYRQRRCFIACATTGILTTKKCFKRNCSQVYKVLNGIKSINNTAWNLSLFEFFADLHFFVYGQNSRFSPYSGKYVSPKSSHISTQGIFIYNICRRYYIDIRLQFLTLHISHSVNKKHYTVNEFERCYLGNPSWI